MASGKKVKKPKGKTINLNDFLADETAPAVPGQAVVMAPRKVTSWADEVEEDDGMMYESRKERVILPTAPRSARNNDVDEDRVPHHPPFLAYMSNLPYDLEEPDLIDFFGKLKIVKVRLPKDDREPNRLKGFGYVEFEERSDLKEALGMTDTSLKNRRVRIEVSDNDGRRGGTRDREASDRLLLTDWRSSNREEGGDRNNDDRGGGFGRREYGGGSGGGFNRDRERGDRDGGRGGGGGFGGDRPERSSTGPWERNRSGPEPERSYDRGGFDRDRGSSDRGQSDRGQSDRGGFDRGDRDRGFGNDRYEGRSNYGSDRYGDRRGGGGAGGGGGGSSSSFGARRGYDDNRRDENRRDEPSAELDASRERPKLNLAPRTKPIAEDAPASQEQKQTSEEESESTEAPSSAPASAPVSSSAIFGGAKPVDTHARELEIEERLAKEQAAKVAKSSEEGEGGTPDGGAPSAPAPSQPSWRSERAAPRQSDDRRDDRRDDRGRDDRRDDRGRDDREDGSRRQEDSGRREDGGRRWSPAARDSGDSRYQAPRGSYQSRPGQSPSRRDGPRPTQQQSGPRAGGGGEDRESRTTRPRPDERPPRKEDNKPKKSDDGAPRMPKYEERSAPDFVQSNLYAALPGEDDVECE